MKTAIINDDYSTAIKLIQEGTNVSHCYKMVYLNTGTYFGIYINNDPLLSLAIQYHRFDIAELLIDEGANVNAKTGCGNTSLDAAVLELHDLDPDKKKEIYEVIHLIIKNGASQEAINGAFENAVSLDERPCVNILIDHVTDKNVISKMTINAVLLADIDLLKILLAHGADVKTPPNDINKLLEISRKNGYQKMLDFLSDIKRNK